jgi:hypothetical protein
VLLKLRCTAYCHSSRFSLRRPQCFSFDESYSGIGFAPCSASIILREQAIIVSIDQYAEAALGNREYFLNKPYGIGGRSDNIP